VTENEILAEPALGEDSRRQFKRTLNNAEQAAAEQPVIDTGLDDLNIAAFSRFYEKKFQTPFADSDVPPGRLPAAIGLAKSGSLTLAGLLLFGAGVPRRLPHLCVKRTERIIPALSSQHNTAPSHARGSGEVFP
jgi:hypothetical protein